MIDLQEIEFTVTKDMFLSDRLNLIAGQYVIIKKLEDEYYISIDFGTFERYSEHIVCSILYLGLIWKYTGD